MTRVNTECVSDGTLMNDQCECTECVSDVTLVNDYCEY